MNLEKYIVKLLYNHDCVVVPEFGAFITQKTASVYQTETSQFFPPAKELTFNHLLTKNDGLLAQEYALINEISFEEAQEKIESNVQFWKTHLANNSSLNLAELGNFTKTKEGFLQFQAQNPNFLLDSFGLDKVHATRILIETSEKSSTLWWKAAAIVPILLGGFLYFGQPQPVSNFVNQQWSGFVSPGTHSSSPETQIVNSSEKIIEIPQNTLDNQLLIQDYQVIAGSFRKLEEAHTLVENLKEKGFENVQFTQKRGSFYFVAFETFPTKEEALDYRKSVLDNYPKTWVLSLKE